MPKPIVAAIAAVCLVAVYSAQPASAQHYHDYNGHHVGHGYHHGSHYYADSFHGYDGYDHAPHARHARHYVDSPVLDACSVPLVESPLDHGYSDSDSDCPNAVTCPLQYQAPTPLAPLYQPTTPYAAIPNQRSIPNDLVNPNDHVGHGHDHGDQSHDGHDHGSPSLPPSNLPGRFNGPDRQSMTAPTLPNRNRSSEPRLPESYPSVPENNGGSIRMDGPPPPSLTRFDRALKPKVFKRL